MFQLVWITEKTKVDDLDVRKLKNIPVDLKKWSDVADNEIVKNTKFNILQTKVNNFETKFLMQVL